MEVVNGVYLKIEYESFIIDIRSRAYDIPRQCLPVTSNQVLEFALRANCLPEVGTAYIFLACDMLNSFGCIISLKESFPSYRLFSDASNLANRIHRRMMSNEWLLNGPALLMEIKSDTPLQYGTLFSNANYNIDDGCRDMTRRVRESLGHRADVSRASLDNATRVLKTAAAPTPAPIARQPPPPLRPIATSVANKENTYLECSSNRIKNIELD